MDRRIEPAPRTAAGDTDLGGDPACWLDRVCFECGRFLEDEYASVCPYCAYPRESTGR